MKRLLLISGMSCVFFAPVFAGSTPSKPQDDKHQTADAGEMNQDDSTMQQKDKCMQDAKKQNMPQMLLTAANDAAQTTTPPPADQTTTPGSDGMSNDQMQPKILLIGGTSPSNTETAPKSDAAKKDKAEPEAEKQNQQQPMVV